MLYIHPGTVMVEFGTLRNAAAIENGIDLYIGMYY